MKIIKTILVMILSIILIVLVVYTKCENLNSLFYGKYKILHIVETFRTLTLFETGDNAKGYEKYLKFDLNYDNDKFVNSIVEISEKFIKVDNNIILENLQYEISIIPSIK